MFADEWVENLTGNTRRLPVWVLLSNVKHIIITSFIPRDTNHLVAPSGSSGQKSTVVGHRYHRRP